MELKHHIETTSKMIIPIVDNIQLVEYKNKELNFVYGMQEYHTSFIRMFKQIIRILCQ
tara:strand:- start:607 stop:780 length:174 start_codon:yes stop_codon:yes gene_type:complete